MCLFIFNIFMFVALRKTDFCVKFSSGMSFLNVEMWLILFVFYSHKSRLLSANNSLITENSVFLHQLKIIWGKKKNMGKGKNMALQK